LNFFVSRWVCAIFVSDFCFRVLPSVRLSQFFCFSGVGGNFFFELEPFLIVLFHVGLDFLFCFTSDLRGFLLEWCFRSFALSFHFIYLASARRRRR
jgi:hypothetical protein